MIWLKCRNRLLYLFLSLLLSSSTLADDWLLVDFSEAMELKQTREAPSFSIYVDIASLEQKGLLWDDKAEFTVRFKTSSGAIGNLDLRVKNVAEEGLEGRTLIETRFRYDDQRTQWSNLMRPESPIAAVAIVLNLKNEGALKFRASTK